MSAFLKNAFIHWKTTLGGFLMGLMSAAYVGFQQGQFQLTYKSFLAWVVPTAWGMLMKDADKSNALNPQQASTVVNVILLLMLPMLFLATPAHAQMYTYSKGYDAQGYLLASDTSGVIKRYDSVIQLGTTCPDTVILRKGTEKQFDSLTVPFLVKLTRNDVQYVGGVAEPIAPTTREILSVQYMKGDTMVFGARALYGTYAHGWVGGTIVQWEPPIPQLIDTLSLRKPVISIQAADSSTTGQTLTNSGMSAAVGVSQTYLVEGYIKDSSSSAAGLKFGWTIPTGATFDLTGVGQTSSTAAVLVDDISAGATAGGAVTTAAGYGIYVIHGWLTTDGTHSGTIALQYLKATSGTAIIKKNSWLTLRRFN